MDTVLKCHYTLNVDLYDGSSEYQTICLHAQNNKADP